MEEIAAVADRVKEGGESSFSSLCLMSGDLVQALIAHLIELSLSTVVLLRSFDGTSSISLMLSSRSSASLSPPCVKTVIRLSRDSLSSLAPESATMLFRLLSQASYASEPTLVKDGSFNCERCQIVVISRISISL